MREIKFRAWNITQRLMVEYANHLVEFYSKELNGDKIELMQFTGLKDKNGKEIYEGDILEIKPNSDDILTVEVIFHKGCFCYKTKEGGIFAFYSSDDWMCIPENKKVIGNIYENPELLKVKK